MTNDDPLLNAAAERIDADAVCAECGSVSTEGTLICKVCGNNLRDQRTRRVRGDGAAEVVVAEPGGASWVGKGVVVFGLLVLLWTAMNLRGIAEWMAGASAADFGNAEVLWTGGDGADYDALLEELRANPVTAEDADRVQEQPAFGGTYDGRYALVGENLAFGRAFLGQAIAKREGNRLLFVALLPRRDIEVRGEAEFETDTRVASRDTAGARIRDRYYGASGFARANADGGFECFALSDYNEESYSITAYQVP